MRVGILNNFILICAALIVGTSTNSAHAMQGYESRMLGRLLASDFPIVHAAYRDFFKEREDFGCFEIFVSRTDEELHVMFLRADAEAFQGARDYRTGGSSSQICGPGARYDFDFEGGLIRKVYIRPNP